MSLEKNRSLILILSTIDEAIKPISRNILLEKLADNDIFITIRTLDRYMKLLKNLHFVNYSYAKKGYEKSELINENELLNYKSLLYKSISSAVILQIAENSTIYENHILTDHSNLKGSEYLNSILSAIGHNKIIQFQYKKQYKNSSTRKIIPQFLKEYENRWYLIGNDITRANEIRTFALDRISEFKILNKVKYNNIDVKEKFKNTIGVNTSQIQKCKMPVCIRFKANSHQKEYIKTLPLHFSQKLLDEDENFAIFQIDVYPNYELKQQFFKNSPFIEILEPKWLRKEFKEDVEWLLSLYKT